MKVIFLILIGLSSLVDAGAFSRSNGVVSDSSSNLEWQDDYSDNNNSIKEITWRSAIDYCENLNLDGKSDWTLPNINELTSLVDDSKNNPSLNEMFQHSNSNRYWSSTTDDSSRSNAWSVSFSNGSHYNSDGNKNNNFYVRCVRIGE
jgi:hypothetical protein